MKPQTMPGEESGAGRIKAPDLYRVKGSLPIPNHTMQGLRAQSAAMRAGIGRGFGKQGFENEDSKIEDGLKTDLLMD